MTFTPADIRALEAISARAWPAAHEEGRGAWKLYATSGYSGRINSCWPLGDPGLGLPDAIASAERWYADHGLHCAFKIVDAPGIAPGLSDQLAPLGYRPNTETVMMVAPASGRLDPIINISAELDPGFVTLFSAAAPDPGDARERLETLARIPRPRAFARADVEGAPAAVGACGVDAEWAGLFSMRTSADFRRRGLARRVLLTLLDWAAEAGARRVWLQVEADNTAALRLYEAAGFEEAYRYRYWRRDNPGA
jgi:GNAT superfamily N-acetyltransferase